MFADGATRGMQGPLVVEDPLGVVGAPLTVKAFAPQTACEVDLERLAARVELIGPDNFRVEDVTISAPRRLDFDVVSADVHFTPAQAGQYLMHVVFAPSLGVRSMLIDVAESRVDPPSVPVTVPGWSECVGGPWPTSGDAVACERNDRRVEVFFADGGVTSFAGQQLVAAGRVLWSVEAGHSQLERRLVADGGLVLTDVWSGFGPAIVRGMHDERTALRARTSGELAVARIEDSRLDIGLQASGLREQDVFFMDAWFVTETPCAREGSCVGLRGLEPGMVWTLPAMGNRLEGVKRPVGVERVPDAILRRKSEGLEVPAGGFERLPLWLPLQGTNLSVLVNADHVVLRFTAWEREQVLRVGRDFVLLRGPDDVVRVTPR